MQHPTNLTIKVLQALHGDALRVRFSGDDHKYHNILVDGGFTQTYRATLRQEVQQILSADERIDLFVITHTDQDHISGVLAFIKEFGELNLVDKYWFNHSNLNVMLRYPGDKISIGNGITLRDFLAESGQLPDSEITVDMENLPLSGAILTVLSPTKKVLRDYKLFWRNEERKRDPSLDRIASSKDDYNFTIEQLIQNTFQEDDKLENGVSITFLFQIGAKSVLFLADSHPSTIVQSLKQLGYSAKSKLKVDYAKLSHHGSKSNTNEELLALLDCNSFIISANGKNRYHFPHKEMFARILSHPHRDLSKHIQFVFNYDNEVIRNIFTESEFAKFNFSCLYPERGSNGYTIH